MFHHFGSFGHAGGALVFFLLAGIVLVVAIGRGSRAP